MDTWNEDKLVLPVITKSQVIRAKNVFRVTFALLFLVSQVLLIQLIGQISIDEIDIDIYVGYLCLSIVVLCICGLLTIIMLSTIAKKIPFLPKIDKEPVLCFLNNNPIDTEQSKKLCEMSDQDDDVHDYISDVNKQYRDIQVFEYYMLLDFISNKKERAIKNQLRSI
ncbi:hypothetical protein [Vibrio chaetopteri]|uniref:Uncharacterized protein n=1 Tax=Vibrio chaetopteri TaxID=3016528 RepID=A0AAU8BR79_9VIBR